jgi:hypothetical protein
MLAHRHRTLPALLLGLVVLPYLMARAFPHACHSSSGDQHGHEAAWLSSHCALCDLAMPVVEALPDTPLRLVTGHPVAQEAVHAAGAACPAPGGCDARGPPRA